MAVKEYTDFNKYFEQREKIVSIERKNGTKEW